MIFFETGLATITYNEKIPYIFTEIRGFIKSEKLRNIAQKQLELIESHRCTVLLNDFRKLKLMSRQDQEWIRKCWFPVAEQMGVQQVAFVIPESSFGELSINRVGNNLKTNVQVALFPKPEQAKFWLRTCQSKYQFS